MTKAIEMTLGRRQLNRLSGYLYWRTRGENLDDPERNGEYLTLKAVTKTLLPLHPIAFDIGANVGDWTANFLKGAESGTAFAFEPAGQTFKALQRRYRTEKRVVCIQAAASDDSGSCVIRVGKNLSGSSSIYRMPNEAATIEENVPAITCDHFAATHGISTIDLMKIDVEGHELNVMRGCSKLLRAGRIRCIHWEYNKTWLPARSTLQDLFELLLSADYKLCKMRQGDLLHYPCYKPALDNYCYSNWVAIRAVDFLTFAKGIKIQTDTAEDW